MKNLSYIATFIILDMIISSCGAKDLNIMKLDPDLYKNYQDEKDMILPNLQKSESLDERNEAPLPKIAPMIAPPPMPAIAKDKLVSISITEDVNLKDVFIELSRLADIDIEIDPSISDGVIFRAKNKPFGDVVDRICNLAGLRYSNHKGILKIEKDTPFLVNYNLDFLNIVRSNSNTTNLSTSLINSKSGGGSSGGSGGSGGSNSGGSTTELKSNYETDLWKSISDDIYKILMTYDDSSNHNSINVKYNTNTNTNSISLSAPDPAKPYISINSEVGMIGVYTNNKQHKIIKSYLEKVRDKASAQVLIEAKVIEVDLKDEYASGVNLSAISRKLKGIGVSQVANINSSSLSQMQIGLFSPSVIGQGKNLTDIRGLPGEKDILPALVKLTQSFGTTRTLSSPRIHAMNNQQAVLSFVENKVYFTVTVQNTGSTTTNGVTSSGQVTLNSTANTVPIGVILALQPSINLDTEEITLNIRPTITRTSQEIQDPATVYALAQSGSSFNDSIGKVPIVTVRELDSIMKIKSGEVMVIGGMITNQSINSDSGVPGLMNIPLFGNLFKSVSKTNSTVQTLIFIQATIMSNDKLKKKDKDFYNSFAVDREVTI